MFTCCCEVKGVADVVVVVFAVVDFGATLVLVAPPLAKAALIICRLKEKSLLNNFKG